MRVGTFAAGIAVLAFLTFGVASVAADVPAPTCEGTGADTIYGNGGGDLICGAPDGSTVAPSGAPQIRSSPPLP